MAELTKKELKQGEKVIGGPKIYFWVISILAGIGTFSVFDFGNWVGRNMYIGDLTIGLPRIDLPVGDNLPGFDRNNYLVKNLVYKTAEILKNRTGYNAGAVIELKKNIPSSAGLGGGWKRFNDPLAKRYLNYGYIEDSGSQENGGEKE